MASITLAIGFVLAGCTTAERERIAEDLERLKPDATETTAGVVTTTTVPAAEVPPYVPAAGDDQTFLWKPAGEHTGKVVVLLPARVLADRLTVGTESCGPAAARANGNRLHFRYGKAGAQYGKNVAVVASYRGDEVGRWVIPDGAARKVF